jgi:hypothetical protein
VDRVLSATLVIVLLALLLALMALGWYLRRRRQRGIPSLVAAPASVTNPHEFAGLYVSTTSADNPLDRIAVRGLGFRARTRVIVADEGIVIPIAGQADSYLPSEDILKTGRATWTIDRVVEPDGLVVVDWRLGDRTLASYFRLDDPAGFITAVQNHTKTGSDAT